MLARLWKRRSASTGVAAAAQLASATPTSASAHREKLIAYFERHERDARRGCKRRLLTPTRCASSTRKNPAMQAMIEGAPRLHRLSRRGVARALRRRCRRCSTDAGDRRTRSNPRLVRGLDYYNRTVFEWITDRLGAQAHRSAGGGRYDGLFEQLGGKPTPACGFAMGIERAARAACARAARPSARDAATPTWSTRARRPTGSRARVGRSAARRRARRSSCTPAAAASSRR